LVSAAVGREFRKVSRPTAMFHVKPRKLALATSRRPGNQGATGAPERELGRRPPGGIGARAPVELAFPDAELKYRVRN